MIRLWRNTQNKAAIFVVIVVEVNMDNFKSYRFAALKYSLTVSQLITSKNALM